MNDDPYGNLLPSSSVLPLPLALLLFLLFFVLGALFAMCESAAETANEIPHQKRCGVRRTARQKAARVSRTQRRHHFAPAIGHDAYGLLCSRCCGHRLCAAPLQRIHPRRAPYGCRCRAFGTALHIAVRRSLSNGSRPRSEKIRSAQGCTRHAAYIQTLPHAVRPQRRHASVCPLVQLHFGRSHASFGQRPQSA